MKIHLPNMVFDFSEFSGPERKLQNCTVQLVLHLATGATWDWEEEFEPHCLADAVLGYHEGKNCFFASETNRNNGFYTPMNYEGLLGLIVEKMEGPKESMAERVPFSKENARGLLGEVVEKNTGTFLMITAAGNGGVVAGNTLMSWEEAFQELVFAETQEPFGKEKK